MLKCFASCWLQNVAFFFIYSFLSFILRDCLTCGLICGTSLCSAVRYVVDSGNTQLRNSFPLVREKLTCSHLYVCSSAIFITTSVFINVHLKNLNNLFSYVSNAPVINCR